MRARNGAGLAHRADDGEARKVDQLGSAVDFLATPNANPSQVIRAELTGEHGCRADGITVRDSNTPVLTICRKLIEAGVHPDRPLHAYRGKTLCLIVRSIGEAARLEINGRGTGFKRRIPVGIAPPMRFATTSHESNL
jgi:hypothetical protein